MHRDKFEMLLRVYYAFVTNVIIYNIIILFETIAINKLRMENDFPNEHRLYNL